MARRPRFLLPALALAAALTACVPGGQNTGGTSSPTVAASSPPVAASASVAPPSAGTAPPVQVQSGSTEAQAAADALAEDRGLAEFDLLADDAGVSASQRRLLQADDPDVVGARVAVALTADGRAKAKARRAGLREKAQARLSGLATTKAAIAAAMTKATSQARPDGGTIRVATLELASPVGPATVKLVRATDADGDLVHSLVRATARADGREITRAQTLRADGGASVRFSRKESLAGGQTLNSTWLVTIVASGAVGGGGQISLLGPDGAVKTLLASLKGTVDAPMIVVKDAAAKLEAEVTLPVAGDATAVLVRADAAGARQPVSVKTK